MRRFLILPVMLLALGLAGCGSTSVLQGGTSLTAPVANPVDSTDIYRAKNVYAGSLELAVEYRNYCWARPYAVLMADPFARPVCQDRRAVVRKVQSARPKAAAAIRIAETFVRNNPTINAGSVIAVMWTAVNGFKDLVPVVR